MYANIRPSSLQQQHYESLEVSETRLRLTRYILDPRFLDTLDTGLLGLFTESAAVSITKNLPGHPTLCKLKQCFFVGHAKSELETIREDPFIEPQNGQAPFLR